MSQNNKGATVFIPPAEDLVSTRHIHQTAEDRKLQRKEHREDKEHRQRLKEERFKKILGNRKGRAGSGSGINVKITSPK